LSTAPEQIDLWRQTATEHQRREFKEAKNQFDTRKLSEYCVALANEGGGALLLGVADRPPQHGGRDTGLGLFKGDPRRAPDVARKNM
jgi:predicted HTH transcriptional regulator